MQPLALFSLATREANWLAAREATVASNVANANTPGYEARDLKPFSAQLDRLQLTMATTNAAHVTPVANSGEKVKTRPGDSWDVVYSGNSVNLEQEMIKAGDIGRAHSLNVNILRSFHQMLMNAAKS